MTTLYDYMISASEHAGSDGDLWLRYLYKVIKDEGTKLTTDDVECLLKTSILTPFQKNHTARCLDRRHSHQRIRFAG